MSIAAPSEEAKAAADVFAMIDHIERYGSEEIKTYMIEDKIWFRANDVARILGYKDPTGAVIKHVSEEDKKSLQSLLGVLPQQQDPQLSPNDLISTYISETGLYDLISSCKLKSGKLFRRWISKELLPKIRKLGQENVMRQLEEMKEQLEDKQKQIAHLEKRQVRLSSFVQNIKKLERNQVFYIASTNTYAVSHLYEYGGTSSLADLKSRFATYNTGRGEHDLMRIIKIYRCNSYTCIEKLTGTILAQFKDKPNGQKEMVRLKYDHLISVLDIITEGCDQAVEHVNAMCQQFLSDTVDTDGSAPVFLDIDDLMATEGVAAPVKTKRRPPRPDISKLDNEEIFAIIEDILTVCVQRDLNIREYIFREQKDTVSVTVPWGCLSPRMKEYRGLSMAQWRRKFMEWFEREKPLAIALSGIKLLA